MSALSPTDYQGSPFVDVVFVGIVTQVVPESLAGNPRAYLKVVPSQPIAVSQDGQITFASTSQHPLVNVTSSTPWVRVSVDNVPGELLGLYYQPGDRITYRHYSGIGQYKDQVLGSFVTHRADLRFWAAVEWACGCGSTGVTSDPGESGDCNQRPLPTPTSSVQFTYTFVAQTYNASATTVANRWTQWVGNGFGGGGLSGTCYNTVEVYNGGGVSGTGVYIDDQGYRTDDPTSSQRIVPVGPLLTLVTPVLDPNSSDCQFTDYWFEAVNSFADQSVDPTQCCGSSSSTPSSIDNGSTLASIASQEYPSSDGSSPSIDNGSTLASIASQEYPSSSSGSTSDPGPNSTGSSGSDAGSSSGSTTTTTSCCNSNGCCYDVNAKLNITNWYYVDDNSNNDDCGDGTITTDSTTITQVGASHADGCATWCVPVKVDTSNYQGTTESYAVFSITAGPKTDNWSYQSIGSYSSAADAQAAIANGCGYKDQDDYEPIDPDFFDEPDAGATVTVTCTSYSETWDGLCHGGTKTTGAISITISGCCTGPATDGTCSPCTGSNSGSVGSMSNSNANANTSLERPRFE